MKVIIIGAGTAGLFAAFELIKAGIEVEVFEAGAFPGGRCSSYLNKNINDNFDNGQHLFMGAYKNFFELVNAASSIEHFKVINSLNLSIKSLNGNTFHLNAKNKTGKSGLITALMNLEIPIKDKLKIVKFLFKILLLPQNNDFKSAKQLLLASNQSDIAMKIFWEPLIISTLNTTPSIADAQLFITVVKKAFFSDANSSAMIFPASSLQTIYKELAEYLSSIGVVFHFNTRVKKIIFDEKKAIGIESENQNYFGDYVISTVPFHQFNKLIPAEFATIKDFKSLKFYENSTILSVYLWFKKRVNSEEFFASIDSNIQWVFNSSLIQNESSINGKLSISISDAEKFNDLNKYEIIDIIMEELEILLPEIKENKLLDYRIIKEKRATFIASSEIELYRINQKTEINNLFIAGDWTNTSLPATIEGACVSGKKATGYIIKNFNN